ncbi:MAG: bifunctional riboflavin kinase/FAD synthetase [Blautia sp.]|nr:bifunctional riboflavin kinase/FAD synthetase [Blautia sp.]
MEYLRTDGEFPCLSDSAVTLGKFDGLHRGHKKLVEQVIQKKDEGALAVLFAFDMQGSTLLSRNERIHLLEEMGIDYLLECPLNEQIRRMEAEVFVQDILLDRLHASTVVVGEDFRFGHQRKGNAELLLRLGEQLGFRVAVVPREMDGERKVSSTTVREELEIGNMERVRELLGTPFFVEGKVVHGAGIGHKLLLPTTNLVPPPEKRMPPSGVYVTRSRFGDRILGGVTNVGCKPTVDGSFLGVETYLYDCDEDLYEQDCRVEFLHYLRREQRFASLADLKRQLLEDASQGRKYLR